MTENDVKNQVVEYLRMTGWLVLRINSGAVVGQDQNKRRFFWFAKWFTLGKEPQTAGIADILAFKDGRALAIETKRPGSENRITEAQREFLATWADHGGQWCVVSRLDDLLLALSEAI